MSCGVVRTFHNNHNVNEEYFALTDKIFGEYKSYWYNGSLREKSYYVNGNKHGESYRYFANGFLREFGIFKDGKLIYDEEYDYDGVTVLSRIDRT